MSWRLVRGSSQASRCAEGYSTRSSPYTTASLAISAGVNVLALARMLGHTSAKVTLDTYANLFDSDLDAVAMVLDAQFSPQSVPKMCPPAG